MDMVAILLFSSAGVAPVKDRSTSGRSRKLDVRRPLRLQRAPEGLCEIDALARRQEAADCNRAAVRGQHELTVMLRRIVDGDAQPIGLEAPALLPPARIVAFDDQLVLQQADALEHARAAVVEAEHHIEQQDVESA